MKLFELSQIQIKERIKFINKLKEDCSKLSPDVQLINTVIENTNNWFQTHRKLNLNSVFADTNYELPSIFETIYEIMEKSIIEKLPKDERQRIFDDSKEAWLQHYPDFKRISEVILRFGSNEMLIEFRKRSPPSFIRERASEVYKKCLSFKVKLKNHEIENLGYSYTPRPFCINHEVVKLFTDEYASWGLKACQLWSKIYHLKNEFYSLYAYEDWKRCIKRSAVLKEKADEMEKVQEDALSLLNVGKNMLLKHNEAITLEYVSNAFEMSLYEREKEIELMYEGNIISDEEYCYVYTLECELCIFYVGIAANAKQRFEQHVRGAFSNETHLLKSKFIQKYNKDVKQNIVFEGLRKECKKFEKNYIAEHNPLGNMTLGGEG